MKVRELMTPLSEYPTLGIDAKLSDAVMVLDNSKHKDVLITDSSGNLKGVLTMTDILGILEPSYKKLSSRDLDKDTLTHRYVADIFKEFGLWSNSLDELCQKGSKISVVEAMHTPEQSEFLDENDELEHGLHNFVVGVPQPLIVRKNGEITGVLRLSDVFDEVKKRMLACACTE